MRFGFGYRLIGEPAGAKVTTKAVRKIPSPGVLNSVTGTRSVTGENTYEVAIGANKPAVTGFIIGNAANIPPGNWIFELWFGDRKLTEKTFQLYRS
jgi:hypothetical protein